MAALLRLPSAMTSTVATVLIVDDEPAVRDLMARWVASLGLRSSTAASADEALETLRREHCDLAFIDVMMPGRDGLWLATEMQRDHPHTAVVIATAYTDLPGPDREPPPIADFLVKPIGRERFALAVDRGRQWRRQALEDVAWHAQLAVELRDRIARIGEHVEAGASAGISESEVLIAYVGARIPATVAHSERVVRYATSIAGEMGVSENVAAVLATAALFHDVGKCAMPDALLTKPSPLTPGELALMRRHIEAGAEILGATRTLWPAAPIVAASHEWLGGGGYPRRLSGTAIPLASRIIAVADAYDTMTHDRPYRPRLDSRDAVAELLRCSPGQFDPHVVSAFLAVLGRH